LVRVGVLSIQGSVREHIECLARLSEVEPVAVKTEQELLNADALIIPGGESTAIGKLLKDYALIDPILQFHAQNKPIWGTCAGMILLAKEIAGESSCHLGLMDIKIRRNAYGGQLDSFITKIHIPEISNDIQKLIFIRAPYILEAGKGVVVLARVNGEIVAARQGNLLATAFHPELTEDLSFYRYFLKMIPSIAEFRL